MVAQKSSVYALTHINTCWQFTSVISRPMWPISLIFHHKWSRSKLQSCIWKLRLWSQNTHSKSLSVQVRNTLIKVIGDVPEKQIQIKGLVYFWWKDKLLPSTKQKKLQGMTTEFFPWLTKPSSEHRAKCREHWPGSRWFIIKTLQQTVGFGTRWLEVHRKLP